MVDQATASNGADQESKQKRAKGAFPRMSLKKALDLAQAIYNLGEGEPVRRLSVFDRLDKAPESGASRALITASNAYGLTTGNQQSEFLSISERGKRVVDSESQLSKYQAIYEALFSNEIFGAFITKFNNRSVPSDEVAWEYLKRSHQLSDADAKAFLSVIKDNLNDFGLIQEFSGKPTIVSREAALERLARVLPAESTASARIQGESAAPQSEIPPSLKLNTFNGAGKIEPEFHFNIQIHLPDSATPEVYDAMYMFSVRAGQAVRLPPMTEA